MTWEDIFKQISEISDLQNDLITKLDNPMIKEINNRNHKYKEIDFKTLNNAELEHKMEITPYQIIILLKINDLPLPKDVNSIYLKMPQELEKANVYLLDLIEKYKLAINCLDLIFAIENLSVLEYPDEFENNEYTKKIELEDQTFIHYMMGKVSANEVKNFIMKTYKDYIDSLSEDERKNLLMQTFCLSYSRNSFHYFSIIHALKKLPKNYFPIKYIEILAEYRAMVKKCELLCLTKLSLEEIYNEFKFINETEFVKKEISLK